MNYRRLILAIGALTVALLTAGTTAQATDEPPQLKRSWLVPTACPFCDWGANCNCTQQ